MSKTREHIYVPGQKLWLVQGFNHDMLFDPRRRIVLGRYPSAGAGAV